MFKNYEKLNVDLQGTGSSHIIVCKRSNSQGYEWRDKRALLDVQFQLPYEIMRNADSRFMV